MLIQHRTRPRPTENPVMPKPNLELKMDVLCFTKAIFSLTFPLTHIFWGSIWREKKKKRHEKKNQTKTWSHLGVSHDSIHFSHCFITRFNVSYCTTDQCSYRLGSSFAKRRGEKTKPVETKREKKLMRKCHCLTGTWNSVAHKWEQHMLEGFSFPILLPSERLCQRGQWR